MFKVEIIGNLGNDVEIKSDNGRMYAQFSVADTRRFKKDDGTETEVTNWVSCFLSNHESKVLQFLKRGQRVFVRGNGELRLYSSAKERKMKAGLSINVQEIELVGASSSDSVPRELALESGELINVNKLFWINVDSMQPKPTVAYDRRGMPYAINEQGFVIAPQQQEEDQGSSEDTSQNHSEDGELPY